MSKPRSLAARGWRTVLLAWLGSGAGCVYHAPLPPDSPHLPPVVTAPASPEDDHRASGAAAAAASLAASPAPQIVDSPPPPEPSLVDVLILFSSGVPAHARLAERLEHALSAGPYRVHRMAVDAVRARGVQKPPPHQTYHYAVAVGLEAARVATEELRLATVFCQIFNYQPLLAGGAPPVWGVSALPPLELQLRAWKELDPSLARVGMIVAPDHDELLREALAAGRTAGVAIRYERSSSDRQTLYHFRRLAREVDGLWLFPDNRILSPAVIAEMLEQGAANGTQITAFNASSPPPGVLMTAGASPADVADTVALVMARLVAGEIDELAAITPLSRVEIDIDRDVAARLGLTVPALSRATP